MIRIYISDRPIIITEKPVPESEMTEGAEQAVMLTGLDAEKLSAIINDLESGVITAAHIVGANPASVLETVKQNIATIVAAGGLAYTNEKQFLFIRRRGKWDLPKGKLDENENLETCALREVEEETGLKNFSIDKPLLTTYHIYREKRKPVLKESHWFLMKAEWQAGFTPQLNEDITSCEWVGQHQLNAYMSDAHASVIDVIRAGIETITLKDPT